MQAYVYDWRIFMIGVFSLLANFHYWGYTEYDSTPQPNLDTPNSRLQGVGKLPPCCHRTPPLQHVKGPHSHQSCSSIIGAAVIAVII